MISVYNLKPKFQQLLMPITRIVHNLGISANKVTVFTMIISVLFGIYPFLFEPKNIYWLLVPLFFFIRMALNAIDGVIAKTYNQITPLGGFLNELGDIVSDSAVILAFINFAPTQYMYLVVFALLAALTEAAGLCAKGISGNRGYKGPMGKSDRAFVLGTLSLLIGLGYMTEKAFIIVISVLCILSIYTVYNRVQQSLKEIKQ